MNQKVKTEKTRKMAIIALSSIGWAEEDIAIAFSLKPETVSRYFSGKSYSGGGRKITAWPKDKTDELIKWCETGISGDEIAVKMNTTPSAIYSALHRMGISKKRSNGISEETIQAAIALRDEGATWSSIRESLGVSPTSLYKSIKRR